ncbi:hypothetical protein Taro_055227 [Colocasia esculenta]|uniref:RING-type E3 ubiquitin transferase n=1 Tax=Colocasia esculenta TaxID=4460 RepID=A0A843XQW2_COLES|nr:hypothetical protein [Colocasia esculenta]
MTPPPMPILHHDQHHNRRVGRLRRHGSRISVCSPLFLFLFLFLILSLLSSAEAQPPSDSSPPNPYGSLRGGFGPAMGIIVVIMVSAFFFMVFFSIYLRQCGERRDPSSIGAGGRALARSRRGAARGLDASVVQALPTLVYAEVKEHKIGKGALECAVCLSEFEDDETLRLLPKCDHVFHTDCIDVWLSSHTTCPVCRCNLDPDAPPAATDAAVAGPSLEAESGTSVGEGEGEQTHPREGAPDGQRSEVDHVSIVIEEPEAVASPRAMRRMESKSRLRWRWSSSLARSPRFLRSHSTGHSPRPAGDDCERYTLRLPDHIRRDVVAGKFQRYPSFTAAEGNGSTIGKGHRAGGEGSSRGAGGPVGGRSFKLRRWEWAAKSDRWAFFARTFSMVITRGEDGAGNGSMRRRVCSPRKGAAEGDGAGSATAAGEGSVKGKKKVFPAAA